MLGRYFRSGRKTIDFQDKKDSSFSMIWSQHDFPFSNPELKNKYNYDIKLFFWIHIYLRWIIMSHFFSWEVWGLRKLTLVKKQKFASYSSNCIYSYQSDKVLFAKISQYFHLTESDLTWLGLKIRIEVKIISF